MFYVSPMRLRYKRRFVFRVIVLLVSIGLYFLCPETYRVVEPGQFFQKLSPFHLLWAIWLGDMVVKLLAPRRLLAMGAVKQCGLYYRRAKEVISYEELKIYQKGMNRRVSRIFLVWTILGLVLAALKRMHLLQAGELYLISIFFYLCDLICVLFWCPFRVFFMQNRCCTTCRIFNWDHLMMTTPLISIGSFFSWTLVGASLVVFLIWEYRQYRYPERFCEGTNQSLRCHNCSDRLCAEFFHGYKKENSCSRES